MKCLLLSPERALFEGEVRSAKLAAHDGSMGVLAKHAAMIGLLGDGELTLDTAEGERAFIVLGGFYRVAGDELTLLTPEAFSVSEADAEKARREGEEAAKLPAGTDEQYRAKQRALGRARLKQRLANK